MIESIKKHHLYFIFAALLAFVLFLNYLPPEAISETPEVLSESIAIPIAFPPVSLEAEAAVVYDPTTNIVLFNKNAEIPLPLASVTKVMTSIVAMENLPEDYEVVITKEALGVEGDSGLNIGERWWRDELMRYMLMVSSNDAALALALAVESITGQNFVDIMNEKAKTLGLTQTTFYSPSGLDESYSLAGAYGSSSDIAKLILHAWQNSPDIWTVTTKNETAFQTLDKREIMAKNTNQSSAYTTLIRASKTGLTELAGGNLAIVFEAGPARPISIVVLGSSEAGRFTDAENLIDATLFYLSNN